MWLWKEEETAVSTRTGHLEMATAVLVALREQPNDPTVTVECC